MVIAPQSLEEGLIKKVAMVQNAGVNEANGDYTFVKILNNAALFQKSPTLYAGKPSVFSLYRCKLQSKEYAWFISIAPDGEVPGTSKDRDFYSAPSRYQEMYEDTNDVLPPNIGWNVANQHGKGPAPKITIYDLDAVEDIDDRNDSMNIMDDASTSDEQVPSLQENDDFDVDYPPPYNNSI